MAKDSTPLPGYIVSLEGDVPNITSQLRLLPPSVNILTLPAFQTTIAADPKDEAFDAKKYILRVHEAFDKRYTQARTFLDAATVAPRLVFMNGGAVSARTACITRIADEGVYDTEKSEQIYEEFVRDGLAGLREPAPVAVVNSQEPVVVSPVPIKQEVPEIVAPEQSITDVEDKAVDDSGFAGQRDSHQSQPVPEVSAFDDAESQTSEDHAPVQKITRPTQRPRALKIGEIDYDDEYISLSEDDHDSNEKHTSFTADDDVEGIDVESRHSVDLAEKLEDDKQDSPQEDDPQDAVIIEFGTASMVPMRKTGAVVGQIKRSKSMDQGALESNFAALHRKRTLERVRSVDRLYTPAKYTHRHASADQMPDFKAVARSWKYIDQETMTEEQDEEITVALQSPLPKIEATYEPVFPLVEDLVIHFYDGNAYEIFDSVIHSYKMGLYPPVKSSPIPARSNPLTAANNPLTPPLSGTFEMPRKLSTGEEYEEEEYANAWPQSNSIARTMNMPPTPPRVPTPRVTNVDKFVEFSLTRLVDVLDIQNAFRSVIYQRFSPTISGVRQLPFTSEYDRFWKPVLRYDDGFSSDGKIVDQIICLGSADAVDRNAFLTLAGQVERIGSKKSGFSKAASVDIKYFISLAMASINLQVPCDRRMLNPLNYPAVLAEMIIPQLESYLATNETTRYLVIRFDSTTLASVLELRRILGEDSVKVAALLEGSADGNQNGTLMNSRRFDKFGGSYRNGTGSFGSFKSGMRNSNLHGKRVEELFNLANYVVSTSASQQEITNFLNSIRGVMLQKSAFYEPEPENLPPPPREHSPTRSVTTVTSNLTGGQHGFPPRTRQSEKSRPGTSRSNTTILTEDGKWDGFYDSEEDEFDRILMPIVPRRQYRKGNSRKALKWLGLA